MRMKNRAFTVPMGSDDIPHHVLFSFETKLYKACRFCGGRHLIPLRYSNQRISDFVGKADIDSGLNRAHMTSASKVYHLS